MVKMNAQPGAALAGAMAPIFGSWSGVADLYRDAMEANTRQWVLSSASIIQEHTLRAVMEASRSCADALAKNAVDVQQQSLARFADANQKAMEMMGRSVMDAWMGGMTGAR